MRRKRSLQSRLSSGFVWRLTDLRIGPRLRVAFACVFLIMISGGAVTVWEFRTIRDRVRKVSLAEQRVTAVVQVNNSLMMLMSRLHRAAETYQRKEFEIEAWRLLTTFRSQTAGTVTELRQIAPQTGRQELVVDSLNDMLDSLPERIRSLIELARADDWVALRARLTDQVDHTDEVGEQLMEEASAELSEARNHLFENIEAAERRVAQTLAITTLLSLIAAGVLGIIVTQSITRPLAALDGGALAVARGDFSHEVPVTGTDELAQVAEAFNRMTRELADLYVREREARRTAEHLNETLQHANDNLSVFAYSASHDLQEPLRNITLTSQLLQRKCSGQLNVEGKELTQHLVEEARRMSDLIRDLLAYMEVSSDRHGPIASTPAEVAMRVALTNLGTAIASEHASVMYGDLPEIPVEPIHLQQLFQNLIGNAIKYRSDKPPSIQISASEQGGWWHFSVRDNGIGIAPQYHEHIFGLFRRLHSQSERPGTGIGLAICQKIVERYGGRIWIDSAPGKGSDFRFTLPGT
jgi:signal transduction histidine kinase